MKITIGSRGSRLALIQANDIKDRLMDLHPDLEVAVLAISTKGDRVLDRPLQTIGTTGLFVKEVEEALLDGTVDLAVHSLKDMPSQIPGGLAFVAPPVADSPWDCLVAKEAIEDLTQLKGTWGTGSPRRAMQLKQLCPNINCVNVRGNIETRMGKIEAEGLQGVVLAEAGLKRGGHQGRISYVFSPQEMIPAPCQGILGLEIRQGDEDMKALCAGLAHEETLWRAQTERAFQLAMEAGCHTPLGCYAQFHGDEVTIYGCFGRESEGLLVKDQITGPKGDRLALAQALAERIKEALTHGE